MSVVDYPEWSRGWDDWAGPNWECPTMPIPVIKSKALITPREDYVGGIVFILIISLFLGVVGVLAFALSHGWLS